MVSNSFASHITLIDRLSGGTECAFASTVDTILEILFLESAQRNFQFGIYCASRVTFLLFPPHDGSPMLKGVSKSFFACTSHVNIRFIYFKQTVFLQQPPPRAGTSVVPEMMRRCDELSVDMRPRLTTTSLRSLRKGVCLGGFTCGGK